MSMAVVYGILNLLIDGIFQDEFPSMMMNFMMRFGLSHEQANTLYGQIFMENKDLFIMAGFIILFLIFFYFAVSRITNYLESIGEEIENILNESDSPVALDPELRPISEKLNSLKLTLRRREIAATESEQKKNDLVVFLAMI